VEEEIFLPPIGQEQPPIAPAMVEESFDCALLAGPGVGEGEIEVLRIQLQILVGRRGPGHEPLRTVHQVGEVLGSLRKKARADDLDAEIPVRHQSLGALTELGLDFDRDDLKAEHGGHAGDDGKARAPLAEHGASDEIRMPQRPQSPVDAGVVAGDEAGEGAVEAGADEAIDTLARVLEVVEDVRRDRLRVSFDGYQFEAHLGPFRPRPAVP
jgi:hypothetical protein